MATRKLSFPGGSHIGKKMISNMHNGAQHPRAYVSFSYEPLDWDPGRSMDGLNG